MNGEKLQAQVRGLTRDVGALREEVRQEQKKRERLAAHAKACADTRAASEAKVKQLTYVNTKLEQELRTVRDEADMGAAKSRCGLETLKGRLTDVERSVHQRSAEAQRQVQRLHSTVQALQAAAMPLAISGAASAAAAGGPGCGSGRAAGHGAAVAAALKSSLPGGARPSSVAVAAQLPEQLHRQFASLFGGLSQLAALLSGGSSSAEGSAVANPAPLLLTMPNGSTRAVHWQDQNSPANSASSTLGGGNGGASGASHPAADCDKSRLAAEVQRLRAALAEAQQQAAEAQQRAAEAQQQAAAGSGSQPGGAGGSRVEAAMKQLDAVVPQYRAAAQALQGQASVLKEKLAGVCRERAALQDEVGKWRSIAQKHEAAFAEAAAKLHTQAAQSMAVSTQVQTQTDRLQIDVDGLRRRCTELAARLQESQRAVAQMQDALASKDKLVAAQQQTIQQLEGTIREQQADIRCALDLVTGRPGAAAAVGAGQELGVGTDYDDFGGGCYSNGGGSGGFGWETALAPTSAAEDVGMAADGGWEHGDEFAGSSGRLTSLMEAAQAAADAATTWAGGYGTGGGSAAGDWAGEAYSGQPAAGSSDAAAGWNIPAGGVDDSWRPGPDGFSSPPQRAAGLGLPPKQGSGLGSPQLRLPRQKAALAAQRSAGQSLQGSPGLAAGLSAVEADIAGLEDALRSALCDLHI